MRRGTGRSLLVLGTVAILVTSCDSATTSSVPSQPPPAAAASSPAAATPSAPPTAAPTPVRSSLPTVAPPVGPTPAPATLPVRTRAATAEMTVMPDGRLLVAIQARGGDVLAVLGRDGAPAPGWPVKLVGRAGCDGPLVGDDGSIRIVCDEWDRDAVVYGLDAQGRSLPGWPVTLTDGRCTEGILPALDGTIRVVCERLGQGDREYSDHLVFAFDAGGHALPGWPALLTPADYIGEWSAEPAIVGDTVMLVSRAWVDRDEWFEDWLVTVDRWSVVHTGTHVPTVNESRTTIGPDGVAYRVEDPGGYLEATKGSITAFDLDGVLPGWPVTFRGMGSAPVIDQDRHVYVTVGDANRGRSRVMAIDAEGVQVLSTSPWLRISTADPGVDCAGGPPDEPVVTTDGGVFVWKFTESRTFALAPSLRVRPGWPYTQPVGSPPDPCAHADGICCDWPLDTARTAGPDGSLYLALQRRKPSVGGRLTTIDPDGHVRDGWPVELRRPGSTFEAIELAPDGTVYALAIESEGRNKASATILAIGPDGEVRWHTTVADP